MLCLFWARASSSRELENLFCPGIGSVRDRKEALFVEYKNFGTTGLKVSRLALGLGLRGQQSESEAKRMIERALELGINFIDCANIYGPMDDRANIGRSEVVLGQVLQGRRDDLVITTKVASQVGSGPNDRGLSRYHILREVERSLKRLNTDHIDIYLAHMYDESTPLEETVRAFDDLVRSGKVRYLACCNYAAWQVGRALWLADKLNAAAYAGVQNPYSLLNRNLEREMFGLVRDQGLGVMAYSPLAVGLLTGAYSLDQPPPQGSLWARRTDWDFAASTGGAAREVISTVVALAAELGKTPSQLALAWVLSQPEVSVAILGPDTISQVEENVGAVGWVLDATLKAKLDAVSSAFV
ncbi:MAG: aldo/keto reductase [Acidimicrobiia bacterium]|nr:aldo/keto reductase [Acidimicrobiia bacterium]